MENVWQDVKYGARMLAKSPGFTTVAILTLALGIGATTAVFSAVNAVLLKPPAYPHAEQIVFPWRLSPPGLNLGYQELPWSRPEIQLMERNLTAFQSLGAFLGDSFSLTGSGDPVLLDGVRASAGFFPSLGVTPMLGRTFTREEDEQGREHEVVLSYPLWRDRFGADRGIVGRSIRLNSEPYTVIGVMPAGFAFPRGEEMPAGFNFASRPQLWVPLALPSVAPIPGEPALLAVVARRKSGVSLAQAQADMRLFAASAEREWPKAKGWFTSRVTPLPRQVVGDTERPLLLLLGAVVIVLLIACCNVAGLLLARSLSRRREFTLRAALGAQPSRLLRQLLTESLVLAAAGSVVGLILGEAGVLLVRAFSPANLPRVREVSLDLRVFAFTLAVMLASGVLFGLAPALAIRHSDLVESLKERGRRTSGGRGGSQLRQALVVGELALALMLVVAAGLLTRTFSRLLNVDPGFNAEHVLTFQLSLPSSKYSDRGRIIGLYHEALTKLRALPGVRAAGLVETVPLDGSTEATMIRIPGRVASSDKDRPFANYTIASPGYFSAAGTPLLRGRTFRDSDTDDAPAVTVISRAMADKYWPGVDALGQQVALGSSKYPTATIVGIVADVKRLSLREQPGPEMYVPYTQKVYPSLLTMNVIVRSQVEPSALTGMVRRAIASVDPELPLAKVETLAEVVNDSLAQPRFSLLLMAAFGGLALLLAGVGLYGVISYSVAQRTQEIGIRMALGASRRNVFAVVVGQGGRMAALGIGLGLGAALAATRTMASYLYGVEPTDGLTLALVCLLLASVAMLACYLPARRATKVDPMVALRYE
jgi:putative ABC transport system permease protein